MGLVCVRLLDVLVLKRIVPCLIRGLFEERRSGVFPSVVETLPKGHLGVGGDAGCGTRGLRTLFVFTRLLDGWWVWVGLGA